MIIEIPGDLRSQSPTTSCKSCKLRTAHSSRSWVEFKSYHSLEKNWMHLCFQFVFYSWLFAQYSTFITNALDVYAERKAPTFLQRILKLVKEYVTEDSPLRNTVNTNSLICAMIWILKHKHQMEPKELQQMTVQTCLILACWKHQRSLKMFPISISRKWNNGFDKISISI